MSIKYGQHKEIEAVNRQNIRMSYKGTSMSLTRKYIKTLVYT